MPRTSHEPTRTNKGLRSSPRGCRPTIADLCAQIPSPVNHAWVMGHFSARQRDMREMYGREIMSLYMFGNNMRMCMMFETRKSQQNLSISLSSICLIPTYIRRGDRSEKLPAWSPSPDAVGGIFNSLLQMYVYRKVWFRLKSG